MRLFFISLYSTVIWGRSAEDRGNQSRHVNFSTRYSASTRACARAMEKYACTYPRARIGLGAQLGVRRLC